MVPFGEFLFSFWDDHNTVESYASKYINPQQHPGGNACIIPTAPIPISLPPSPTQCSVGKNAGNFLSLIIGDSIMVSNIHTVSKRKHYFDFV